MSSFISLVNTVLHSTRRFPRKFSRLCILSLAGIISLCLFLGSSGFQARNHIPFSFELWKYRSSPSSNIYQYLEKTKDVTDSQSLAYEDQPNLKLWDYDRDHIKYIYPEIISAIYNHTDLDAVDWSKYAYVLYATSSSHLCNSLMIFAELRKFETRAQLVLLVRKEFLEDKTSYSSEYNTLTSFAERYNVILKPTEVKQITGDDSSIWVSSFTKLMVFNETDYDRVIYLDADAILLRGNLDELFFLPPAKLATPTAYWLTKIAFEKLDNEKYDPKRYGWHPLTAYQRNQKLNKLIEEDIMPFLNPRTNKLFFQMNPNNKNDLRYLTNERNFYNNLYNDLPNYFTIDEFALTNIVMVIQPSQELFSRIEDGIAAKQKNEYDMEIVQNHLVPLDKVLQMQSERSFAHYSSDLQGAINEVPEFLLIPHQVYGTITPELNSQVDHFSYMADTFEQVFSHLHVETNNGYPAYYEIEKMDAPGDHFLQNIKYLHFSDAPIPKPWFTQDAAADYMGYRTRCESHPDFKKEGVIKPKYTTPDCSNGKNWESIHELFKNIRWDVCHLELISTSEDTYNKIIN